MSCHFWTKSRSLSPICLKIYTSNTEVKFESENRPSNFNEMYGMCLY